MTSAGDEAGRIAARVLIWTLRWVSIGFLFEAGRLIWEVLR